MSTASLVRFAAAVAAVFFFGVSVSAQVAPRIHFRVGESRLDRSIRENARALAGLDSILLNTADYSIDSVLIVSMSSPEGPVALNNRLSLRRAASVMEYLTFAYPHLANRIRIHSQGEAWGEFRDMVAEDQDISDATKDKVLDIVDSHVSDGEKERRLRSLPEFRYIASKILPELRVSIVFRTSVTVDMDMSYLDDILSEKPIPVVVEPVRVNDAPLYVAPMTWKRDVKFAVKTNLLYDLAATPNISVEFPFRKDRFSAGLNYEFPWFVWAGNSRCWEILHAEPFFRVWPGSRKGRPALTGFYVGAVAGLGYYDIEPHHKGWQGEAVNAGLEAGYAWAFGKDKRWRFETGIGAGWMRTQYSYYEANEGDKHLLWQRDGRYGWFGPVKVNASVSYVIFKNNNKRRGGR